MLLGRSSPVSLRGQPGQVHQDPGRSLLGQLLHPGGEQFPSFGHRSGLCQRVLLRRRPFIPGRSGEAAHAPPLRGVPRRGPAHGRTRRCLGLPCRLPPAPLRLRASALLTHPSASRCLPPAVASLRGLHTPGPGRPVLLTRFAPWRGRTPRWSSRRKVSSEERGGTGRGGAGRRGGRKSAWRKGRGGGPCSPTGSRWGGRSQGQPQLVLTTTSLTKHP